MAQLQNRVEKLGRQTESADEVLIVVGGPTTEQREALDSGQYRIAVHLPDNGRDPEKNS